jgi:hypothetical protein
MSKWRERSYRTRLLGSALLVAVFGAGAVVGLATRALVTPDQPLNESEDRAQPSSDRIRGRGPRGLKMDSLLFDEIGASPDQRSAINSILDDRDRLMRAQWYTWESRFDTLMNETRGQVRAVLTADQTRKLDQAIAERVARRRARQNNRDSQAPPADSQSVRHPSNLFSMTAVPAQSNR